MSVNPSGQEYGVIGCNYDKRISMRELGERPSHENRVDVMRQASQLYDADASVHRIRTAEGLQEKLKWTMMLMLVLGDDGLEDVLRGLGEIEKEARRL